MSNRMTPCSRTLSSWYLPEIVNEEVVGVARVGREGLRRDHQVVPGSRSLERAREDRREPVGRVVRGRGGGGARATGGDENDEPTLLHKTSVRRLLREPFRRPAAPSGLCGQSTYDDSRFRRGVPWRGRLSRGRDRAQAGERLPEGLVEDLLQGLLLVVRAPVVGSLDVVSRLELGERPAGGVPDAGPTTPRRRSTSRPRSGAAKRWISIRTLGRSGDAGALQSQPGKDFVSESRRSATSFSDASPLGARSSTSSDHAVRASGAGDRRVGATSSGLQRRRSAGERECRAGRTAARRGARPASVSWPGRSCRGAWPRPPRFGVGARERRGLIAQIRHELGRCERARVLSIAQHELAGLANRNGRQLEDRFAARQVFDRLPCAMPALLADFVGDLLGETHAESERFLSPPTNRPKVLRK